MVVLTVPMLACACSSPAVQHLSARGGRWQAQSCLCLQQRRIALGILLGLIQSMSLLFTSLLRHPNLPASPNLQHQTLILGKGEISDQMEMDGWGSEFSLGKEWCPFLGAVMWLVTSFVECLGIWVLE